MTMDFLKPEFESAIKPSIDDDGLITIGKFDYSASDVLRMAGDAYHQVFHAWIWEDWIPTRRERKDELLTLNANGTRYEELKRIIASGRAIPFVGSGMSQPTGMPTWENFLKAVCKQTKGFSPRQLQDLLDAGNYETAASRVFASMPLQLFNERFEATFSLSPATGIKGPIRFLPFLFDSIVITTNFDGILENIYAASNQSFQSILHGMAVADYRKRTAIGARCLLKLHGNYSEIHGRVLTAEEYDRFYGSGCNGREELSLLFRRGSLLFLGASLLQDRTMTLLKEVAASDANMPRHYAFLKRPQVPARTKDREHFLAERNIFPIWYNGGHNDDIEALMIGLMEDLKKF